MASYASDAPPTEKPAVKDVRRLAEARKWSFDRLKPFRDNREKFIREYVGDMYNENGADNNTPLNFIALAMEIYTRQLLPNAPKVMVSTKAVNLKPVAHTLELALNHLITEVKLHSTFEDVIKNAMFSLGICKVGLCSGGYTVSIDNEIYEAGQPFADNVDLDDWVHDVTAARIQEGQFWGMRIRRSKKELMESGKFNNEALLKITSDDRKAKTEGAAKIILGSGEGDEKEYIDTICIWELYIPAENKLIYLPDDCDNYTLLGEMDWEGPEGGPYHFLGFMNVPKNSMPLPPVSLWYDLHRLGNKLMNKLSDQASRQKTILAVMNGQEGDAVKITNTPDGHGFACSSGAKVEEVRYGGADQATMATLIQTQDLQNKFAGNVETLGGLGAASDTVGQDKLITESANTQMKSMQKKTAEILNEVIQAFAAYLWEDPFIELPLYKRVPGTDIEVPVVWNAEMREGTFREYNIVIDTYSTQDDSPQAKLKNIQEFVNTYVPLLQLGAQQGVSFNLEGLMRTDAKYRNMTDLDDIIMIMQPMMQPDNQEVGVGAPPVKSTTRTNVRVNKGGGAQMQGNRGALLAMMGGGSATPTGAPPMAAQGVA